MAERLLPVLKREARKGCRLPADQREDIEQVVLQELVAKTVRGDQKLKKLVDQGATEVELVERIRSTVARVVRWRSKDAYRRGAAHPCEPLLEDGELPGAVDPSLTAGRMNVIDAQTIKELLAEPYIREKVDRCQWEIVDEWMVVGGKVTDLAERIGQSRSTVYRAINAVVGVLRKELV